MKILGQALFWAAVMGVLGALAQGPSFQPWSSDQALLKLSVAHLSERLAPCRTLSPEEQAELPPTRRVTQVCERGRAPTRIQLQLNGEILVDRTIKPAGLSADGRSYFLEVFPIAAGAHALTVQMADTPREDGFDLTREINLDLRPGQALLVEIGDQGVILSGADPRPSVPEDEA